MLATLYNAGIAYNYIRKELMGFLYVLCNVIAHILGSRKAIITGLII
jgi:hypothetical protein